MLIFYKFKQKSTMCWIIISSEILGPHLVRAPRIAGAAGAVVTPLILFQMNGANHYI